MTPRSYLRIAVDCASPICDDLAAELAEAFATAVEITDTGVRFYLEEPPPADWEGRLRGQLERAEVVWPQAAPLRPSVDTVEDEGWEDRWKEHFKPFHVGRHFFICPTWEEALPQPGDRLIRIDPGRAFGTGHHETTRLCLEWLEAWSAEQSDPAGSALLDLGTGSGILAIGAALLGVGSIVGVDIDSDALAVARENAELNAVSERITLIAGSVMDVEGRFDAAIANIQAAPLAAMAHPLVLRIAPSGRLALSGILTEQADEVREAYEAQGLRLRQKRVDGEWCLLDFEHRKG